MTRRLGEQEGDGLERGLGVTKIGLAQVQERQKMKDY